MWLVGQEKGEKGGGRREGGGYSYCSVVMQGWLPPGEDRGPIAGDVDVSLALIDDDTHLITLSVPPGLLADAMISTHGLIVSQEWHACMELSKISNRLLDWM